MIEVMQNDRNFIDELKYQYKHGGMHIKLIFVNALVFIVIGILSTIAKLSETEGNIQYVLEQIFTLRTTFYDFILKPWGILTSIFAHFGFMHLLLNMIMLYFAGRVFEQFFSSKRLLAIYFLGGISGGIFEILAHELIPSMSIQPTIIVGASGSIMAIFIGLAFYKPTIPINLFGLFQFPIIYLGLAYLLYDVLSLGANDGTAHFAHLGGAVIGVLASQKPFQQHNLVFRFERFLDRIITFFSTIKQKQSKPKFKYDVNVRNMKDEDFILEKKRKQEQVNQILDKISRSGYESLTKAEKDFLFKQSKND